MLFWCFITSALVRADFRWGNPYTGGVLYRVACCTVSHLFLNQVRPFQSWLLVQDTSCCKDTKCASNNFVVVRLGMALTPPLLLLNRASPSTCYYSTAIMCSVAKSSRDAPNDPLSAARGLLSKLGHSVIKIVKWLNCAKLLTHTTVHCVYACAANKHIRPAKMCVFRLSRRKAKYTLNKNTPTSVPKHEKTNKHCM